MANHNSENWRDGLVSVSIANLAMIDVWRNLLYVSDQDRYYLRTFSAQHYASAALLLLLLSVIVWAGVWAIRRLNHPAATFAGQLGVLLLLINMFEYFRESLGITRLEVYGFFKGLPLYFHLILATLGLGALATFVARRQMVSNAGFVALLIASPMALSNVVQVAWRGATVSPGSSESASVHVSKPRSAEGETRVVWIVFDEFDYRLGFPDRPEFIDLPEFDRFRGESFFATQAQEPATSTVASIPSFLLGEPVVGSQPTSANRCELTFGKRGSLDGTASGDFKDQKTFFHRVRDRNLRLGIVGIYHPYCRLFEGTYESCYWDPFLPGGGIEKPDTPAKIFANQVFKLLPVVAYRGEHIASIERSVEIGGAAAADPQLDVVFLHLPLPHAPYVYDQNRETMTMFNFSPNAYYEQMVLADRSFGEIRRAMEAAGTWERSIVLVTSDHGWRFAEAHGTRRDHRVPFMLKLPGKSQAIVYQRSFRAWEANAILLAALSGELTDARAIAGWLDERWPADGEVKADTAQSLKRTRPVFESKPNDSCVSAWNRYSHRFEPV